VQDDHRHGFDMIPLNSRPAPTADPGSQAAVMSAAIAAQ
jgi:hypothetical protein